MAPVQINAQWKRWIAECKLAEVADSTIVEQLGKLGCSVEDAQVEIAAVTSDPIFSAATQTVQRLRKLQSLLDVYRKLDDLLPSTSVDLRRNLRVDDFIEHYYSRNRPVVLLDVVDSTAPILTWTPERLKQSFDDEIVEVMLGRAQDPEYEINSERHKSTMRFGDYADLVTQSQGNDIYLVANNNFLEREAMHPLRHDAAEVLPEYLDPTAIAKHVFLWFGPEGTVTPLHHDVMNVLFLQLYGHKRFTLVPSNNAHLVRNEVAVYSRVDAEAPDLTQYPEFKNARRLDVLLGPGEALFIPVGWWHHVRSLETSVSVSFTNFRVPNQYEWKMPSIRRKA